MLRTRARAGNVAPTGGGRGDAAAMPADSDRPCEVCDGRSFAVRFEKAAHRYVRCRSCGLERIDPPPTDAELAAVYGRRYYDAWGLDEGEAHVRGLKTATFRRVVAAAGILPRGALVLDCGAATGFLMEVAAERGYEPYGVELSAYGAGAIAERFGRDRVFAGEIEEAGFPGREAAAFSAVFMCDYLEHVRDPRRVLRRAATLLRPEAPVVISTPRIGSLSHRVMRAGWPHYKTEHLYYFTPRNLRRLLESAGFHAVHWRAARKTVTIDYVAHHFGVYRHPLWTPATRVLRGLPRRARALAFPAVLGEMLVVARRAAG
jgi:2-polyprenyl-3-methyl-5-hydroxy-6-metoxy-1,4-benzoquinol methylase